MICRMRPYDVHSSTSMEEIHALMHNTCLHFPKHVDRRFANLIQQLLSLDPKTRISSIKEIKKHSYMESLDISAVYNRQIKPHFIPSKDQLNCDPTFELEEMIIESKPLHKKKKRLSKRNKTKCILTSQISKDEEAMQMCLSSIQNEFIVYNRESELEHQVMEEKRKLWEEELAKVVS
ncbi:Serine/threonine-protein kinase 32B, partial [Stegodyphus mimosarum]